jgi:hypothetical protein
MIRIIIGKGFRGVQLRAAGWTCASMLEFEAAAQGIRLVSVSGPIATPGANGNGDVVWRDMRMPLSTTVPSEGLCHNVQPDALGVADSDRTLHLSGVGGKWHWRAGK